MSLDQRLGGEGHLLQLLGVRRGDVGTSDTLGGCVEVVECVLHGKGEDLSADTESRVAELDDHQTVGLLDRLDDGLKVEGLDGTQVDDLSINTVVLLQVLSGDEGLTDASGHGHDGEILAGALNLGLAEGNHKVILLRSLGHGEALTVHELVLKDHNGVRVADGSLQETLGILRRPRGDDLQTGDAAVPGAEVLRVLGGDTGGEAVGATEGDVAGLNAAGHVQGLGCGVDDLVDSLHGKVEGHELALDGGQNYCLVPWSLNMPALSCRSGSWTYKRS